MTGFDPTTLRAFPAQRAAALPPLLRALWHDAQGDWQAAHETAQDIETPDGARVHAFLHRSEGDNANAAYWYRRAGQPVFQGSLAEEWDALVRALSAP